MPRHANASTARPIEGGAGKADPSRHRGGDYWATRIPELAANRNYRESQDSIIVGRAKRTGLPDTACFCCGARGLCGHNGRTKENWE